MEVRKGYKKTEVGVIPEDWTISILDELVDDTRSIRYGIVQPGKFEPEGRYMVRGQDYSFGWVDSNELFRVSDQIEERYKNARIKGGDIILTIVGAGTGHLEVVPNWLDGANITQTTARIAIDKNRADSKYCKYYFQTSAGRRQISVYIKGAAQPGLNIRDVKIFQIPLPPTKEEQTTIATILSDADALIVGLEKLIEKKRAIKQGAMQELLTGKKRIVGFENNSEYKQTELGKIPEDWNLIQVGSLTKFHKQGYYTKEGYNENSKYYLLRGTDMQNPLIDLSSTPKINANVNDYEAYKVLIGDFLFVRSGAIGRYGIVNENTPKSIFGSYLINFRFNEFLDTHYFGYFYQSEFAISQIKGITQGGGNLNINAENIKSLKIALPPTREEQACIATILSDMDAEITALEQKLSKYKMIKQGMMQELLTGRVRLV